MASLDRTSVKSGVYRHFKGNMYHVLGVSGDAETSALCVWCIPQAGEYAGVLTHRRLENFLEIVKDHKDRPEYVGPRFELVEERDFLAGIR